MPSATERISPDRLRLFAQVDALEAAGAPADEIKALRDGVTDLRMPDDGVTAHFTHADAVLGAAQLKTLVKVMGDRMPESVASVLLRIAAALAEAR